MIPGELGMERVPSTQSRNRLSRLAQLGILGAALLVLAQPVGADGTGFEFSGDCVVGIFFVPADGDRVQEHLPPGYTVQADPLTRRAVLIVEAGSCSNVTIDGRAEGDYRFGEILALIGPPGHEAASVYDFGAPTDSSAIAAESNALGLGPLHLLTKEMSVTVGDAARTVTATVPWVFSPYSFRIEARSEFARNPDPNDRCCAWTEGSRGTVGGRFRLSHEGEPGELDAGGIGTLEAREGSPLAQMLGSTSFTGPAFIRQFHFDATVRLFD